MKLRTLIYMLIASLALQSTLCATVEDLIKSLQNLQTLQLQLLGALQDLSKTPGEKEWERLEKWPEGTYPSKIGTPGFPKKIPAPFWVDMAPGPLRIISKTMPYPLHWVASFVPPYVDQNDTKECDKQSAPGIEYVINHQDWKESGRSIDEHDGDGKTALEVAVENDRPLTAKELIKCGAAVTSAIAAKAKNDEMRAVLESKKPTEPAVKPKEKPAPQEEKPEEKAIKITLPGAEYRFLFNHSFATSIKIEPAVFDWLGVADTKQFEVHDLAPAVEQFMKDLSVPEGKQADIMPKALEIGAGVFAQAVTQACEKYIKDSESNQNDVAKKYFAPVCHQIINLAIIQAAYNKRNLVEAAAGVEVDLKVWIKNKLKADGIFKLFKDLTQDDEKLIEAQFESAKQHLDHIDPKVTISFIAAQNAAVDETIRLLKLWYEAGTKPKFEKVKKLFADKGVKPKKSSHHGDVDLLIGFRKVLFLPKIQQLIDGAAEGDKALYTELQQYIASDQYLIDGIPLDDIDKIILKPAMAGKKHHADAKKVKQLTSPNAEILAALKKLPQEKESVAIGEIHKILGDVAISIRTHQDIKWDLILKQLESELGQIKTILKKENVKADLTKKGYVNLYTGLKIV